MSLFVGATASTATFAFGAMLVIALFGAHQDDLARAIVAVASLGVFTFAVVRVRCVVSPVGIEVVNLWRTRFVPWASVERVELAHGWLGGAFLFFDFSPLRIRTMEGGKIIVQASLAEPDKVIRAIGPYLALAS